MTALSSRMTDDTLLHSCPVMEIADIVAQGIRASSACQNTHLGKEKPELTAWIRCELGKKLFLVPLTAHGQDSRHRGDMFQRFPPPFAHSVSLGLETDCWEMQVLKCGRKTSAPKAITSFDEHPPASQRVSRQYCHPSHARSSFYIPNLSNLPFRTVALVTGWRRSNRPPLRQANLS